MAKPPASKIVRRPDRAEGGITAQEKVALDAHAQMWIARILRTTPIDPKKIGDVIRGLYRVSGLAEPRVIVVPSPLVAAVAGGFASAILACRGRIATADATHNATAIATDELLPGWAVEIARDFERETGTPAATMLAAARTWSNAYQGGAFWGQYDSYLTGMRDVLGLRLPVHDAYQWWERAAIEGGARFMHPDFCLVSDFPTVINRDEQARPHCADGPSLAWRDGWSLWHWHGVVVPRAWIVGPRPSASEVLAEQNAETRRAGMEILGWDAVLAELGARTIDTDADPQIGTLIEVDLPDSPKSRFIRVKCATGRWFALPVPQEMKTALEANAWTYGLTPLELRSMQVRS